MRRPAPRSHGLIVRWAVRACAVYGLAGTAALLAVRLVGDRTAWSYTLGLVSFWWLLPAPVLLVVPLAARSWRAAAALLVPAVVCAALQGPYLVHRLTGSDAAADLRVATYNMTNGTAVNGVVDLAATASPDVLLLQEVTASAKADLQRELPDYRYTWFGPVLGARGGDEPDGDAVLSRYPITAVTPVDGLPSGARPTDVVTVAVGGRSLAVLSVHLASPCIGCSVAGHVNPAGSTGEAARIRDGEARRYAEVVSGLIATGQPVVLAGDLNSSPLNRPVHLLTGAGLTDVHQAVGTTPGLTRGPGPGVARVDFVLVAGLVPVRDAEGGRDASTHSPVIADLVWPA